MKKKIIPWNDISKLKDPSEKEKWYAYWAKKHSKEIEKWKKEVETHTGELVLDGFHVVRLKGWFEDEDDNYYTVLTAKCEIQHCSAVGWFTRLKGFIPKKEYDYLNESFKINIDRLFDMMQEAEKKKKEICRKCNVIRMEDHD